MKVLFLNPPYLKHYSRSQRSPAVTRSGTIYYPMYLAYAAALLDQHNFEIDFIDAPADGSTRDAVLKRIHSFNPSLVVVDTSTPSIDNDVEIAAAIKDLLPESMIVLVGPHVSALPEKTLRLNQKIDAIARREYEYTILELAETLKIDNKWESISGISYQAHGKIIHTAERLLSVDLDNIPFVSTIYKRFLNPGNYFNPNALYPMVMILSGRGCPFGCSFCVYPQTFSGKKYRLRSPENVVAELEYIKNNLPNVKAIFFEDDTLTANRERCRELMDLIRERKINLSLTANSRADVDYETLKTMKAAGLRLLCAGFESGEQGLLDKMQKGITLEKTRQFRQNCRRLGILVHGCFIFGNPGETRESMKNTLQLALELNPDTAQFYPMMVYPGTRAYSWAKENDYLITEDYSRWLSPEGFHECVISTPEISNRELVDFCRRARKEFYLRPSYVLGKLTQMVRQPREIRRILKAAGTFWKHLARDITHN